MRRIRSAEQLTPQRIKQIKERMIVVFDDENQDFAVVVNAEDQYSIWPSGREFPVGWHLVGFRGLKSDCLAYIDTVWTDITPLSARQLS